MNYYNSVSYTSEKFKMMSKGFRNFSGSYHVSCIARYTVVRQFNERREVYLKILNLWASR